MGERLMKLVLGSASTVTLIRHGDSPAGASVFRTMDFEGEPEFEDRGARGPQVELRTGLLGDEPDMMEMGSGEEEPLSLSMMITKVVIANNRPAVEYAMQSETSTKHRLRRKNNTCRAILIHSRRSGALWSLQVQACIHMIVVGRNLESKDLWYIVVFGPQPNPAAWPHCRKTWFHVSSPWQQAETRSLPYLLFLSNHDPIAGKKCFDRPRRKSVHVLFDDCSGIVLTAGLCGCWPLKVFAMGIHG